MCDTALSFAWDKLLPLARDHLLPLLKEAANMIRGVPKEVEELKDQLESIEKFINDADRIAEAEEDNTRHGIRAKITQLIEASFLIQDVIDEYMMMCEEEHQPGDNPGCVAGVADLLKTTGLRLQIAYKIQSINSRINDMKDTRGRDDVFQVEGGTSSSTTNQNTAILMQNLRDAPLYVRDTDVVGFDVPKNKLIDWLIGGRLELTVVCVVAMGGQGKTTLAKKVFDNGKVTKHFDCCVWVTVSQSYTIEILLRNMLKNFYKQDGKSTPQEIFEMDPRSLRDEVRNYLQQKRYVIVFDDVWNPQFWDDIEFGVVDNNNGSRILITTRNMGILMSCKRSSFVKVHVLQPLTPKQSLELFNKKAFRDLNGCCPNNLIDIASQIVEKCNGLPLAIMVISGLLSTRDRNTVQWKKFNEGLNLELKEHSQLIQIGKILGLSYHDLHYNLKSCLLYFGMYPEDFIVNSRRLIRQWISEGFVKEKRGKTLEEVAEGYLTDLINRSLVQVSSISIDGRVKSCRVHDLLLGMILEKSEDLRFCKNIGGVGQSFLSGIIRRLSITSASSSNLTKNIDSSHVRSLFVLTGELLQEIVRQIPTKYKLLKVLNFGHFGEYDVPENLGSLIHLKYFSFKGRGLNKVLPKSIGMLQNLETLDLRGTLLVEMPKEITLLRKLQHLLGKAISWIQLKDGIGGMKSLQTLVHVALPRYRLESHLNASVELVKELGKLEQLKKFGVRVIRTRHEIALFSSINRMQQLEKLNIKLYHPRLNLDLLSPSPMLQSLTLNGTLEKLPMWIPKLQNLVKLKLKHSWLTDDPMKSLKTMQNLLSLSVTKFAYGGEILYFEEGGFQNLKELSIQESDSLESIFIEKLALPSLRKLDLRWLPKLTMVPIDLQHLKSLEVVNIGGLVGPSVEWNTAATNQNYPWKIIQRRYY